MSAFRRRVRRITPWFRRFRANGWRRDKCEHCGHGFRWSRDARHATGNRDGKHYHGPCIAYLTWRSKADARLTVLGVAMELSALTARDVKGAIELRASGDDERVTTSSTAFSVFYDLERSTAARDPEACT